jgi:hypothetical protein
MVAPRWGHPHGQTLLNQPTMARQITAKERKLNKKSLRPFIQRHAHPLTLAHRGRAGQKAPECTGESLSVEGRRAMGEATLGGLAQL